MIILDSAKCPPCKVAGWILSPEDVEDWARKHMEPERVKQFRFIFQASPTCAIGEMARERSNKPISDKRLLPVIWPKTPNDTQSELTLTRYCLIVRHSRRMGDAEDWQNYQEIEMEERDKVLREILTRDGLCDDLPWVTVPDPRGMTWPFSQRWPESFPLPDPVTPGSSSVGVEASESQSNSESPRHAFFRSVTLRKIWVFLRSTPVSGKYLNSSFKPC
ncbi:hypothetical protein VKT23_008487 [Stygiomarasmius scandens]|uniref:Uncharacterized protein n=1 Tax=Marasmiellus scandens TaxID=2682957 RepID=A0ABR1JKU3_9AGAR